MAASEIFHLELVRIGRLHGDPLDAAVPPELDHGVLAVPGIVEEERALRADRLELVAVRRHVAQSNSASTSPGKRSEPVKAQSVPVGPMYARPKTRLGLAPEQARAADAVAPDVHQRAAVDVGLEADVDSSKSP